MFRLVDKSSGFLFSTNNLDASIAATVQALRKEVEAISENRLLNTAPEDLIRNLVEKRGMAAVTLDRENWYVDYQDGAVAALHRIHRSGCA